MSYKWEFCDFLKNSINFPKINILIYFMVFLKVLENKVVLEFNFSNYK